MEKTYRLTPVRRAANTLVRALLRVGLAPRSTYRLIVGLPKQPFPFDASDLGEEDSALWLVALYGAVSWVRNARASGVVTLSRGRRSETVWITELEPQAAGRVLKRYVTRVPITRSYFDATPASPVEAFAAEARHHPVFRILDPDSV
jgi:hypothetical protein